jgi:hypothetical protein
MENKYSQISKGQKKDFFNHLSLLINRKVQSGELSKYIDLLRELKQELPLKIKIDKVLIVEGQHLALSFDTQQTEKIRKIAKKYFNDGIVDAFYTKVVWYVPKNKQNEVTEVLKKTEELIFDDFVLCANKQNDNFVIYTSNSYKVSELKQ